MSHRRRAANISRAPRIGLTGSLASGKSTVLKAFQKAGWKVFSADQAVHDIYKEKDVEIERLRKACAKSPRAITQLEKKIHPLVRKRIHEFLKKNRAKPCIVEIPLLFEANEKARKSGAARAAYRFDSTIFVYAPQKDRLARAKRRGMKPKLFKSLDSRQLSPVTKAELADFVIHNRFGKKELKSQAKLLSRLLSSSESF